MPIFILSDTANLNDELKSVLASELKKRGDKVAYISSSQEKLSKVWFENSVEEYKIIDSNIIVEYFDLSSQYTIKKLKQTLQFGAIHLSGGNTFQFLNSVRKRSFQKILKRHLDNEGLIIGVSAGSIILTPSIHTASFNGDVNAIRLRDWTGLNLLPFEFYPHFNSSKNEIDKLIDHSVSTENLILACMDGDGILFENNRITCIGNVTKFHCGRIYRQPFMHRNDS